MRRWIVLLLALAFLGACPAAISEEAFLTGEDLSKLQPAYEEFLSALADRLVERGLLLEDDREDWALYQIGDFLQNGGYGSIAILYTPGLLQVADESVSARRLVVETNAGDLTLQTLRSYSERYSPLPGLPLDAELTSPDGAAVACRFRWVAPIGSFFIWDGTQVINVGATFISDGRPLYWYAEPAEGITEALTLHLLHPNEDTTLATVTLTVHAGADSWSPEDLQ